MEGLPSHIERVLDAARTAPSYDNRQPWRFAVDGETVSFGIDHERDGSSDGTMARIALGAAIECACIAAARTGAAARYQAPREGFLVTLSFTGAKRLPDPDKSRTRRVTNRRVYDGRAVDDAMWQVLREATPARDLAQTHWFGRGHVRALGPVFEEAEELYLGDPGLRERAMSSIRFDVKDRDEVTHGLSIGSLELSSAERATLERFRKPRPPISATELKKMGARARRLIESASGVSIFTTVGADPMTDVDVGRTMQRAWMVLTQRGLAAHPMTTVMRLELARKEADEAMAARIDAVVASFRRIFPHVPETARIAFLMRFGWADAPSCRVGRLTLEESLTSSGEPPA